MKSLQEISGKKAALGAGAAAALAGGGLGAAELVKRQKEKDATTVRAAQSHEDRKLAGKTGPTETEKQQILSRKGGVTDAQRETFADKQRMTTDERPVLNRAMANLRRTVGAGADKIKKDVGQVRDDIAKIPGEVAGAAKSAAASPSGQAAKEMVRTAGDFWKKQKKEHLSPDSPTMAGIKGVMKTAGDFWKKKLQDDVDLSLAAGIYKASKR